MRTGDLVSGAAALALALAVCSGARQMPLGDIRNPGAGFLPFWTGVALAVMALTLLARALLERAGLRAPPEEGHPHRVLWTAGATLAFALVLEHVGYLPTMVLLLTVLVRTLGHPGWRGALAFSLVATGASYVLFVVWLGVPLPRGRLLP